MSVADRPTDPILYRVVGNGFVAGFVVIDGIVVDAAPILARERLGRRRALDLYVDKKALYEKVTRGRWWKSALPILEKLGKVERVDS